MQGGQCHFVCLHVWIVYLNQTNYLIRPIIMIITIIRINNKTRKWTPSLIITSLTYVCVSSRKNFFQICSSSKFNDDMGLGRTLFKN